MDIPQKTPLYDTHVAFGARMVDFAGWLMPLQYRGIIAEHVHTRTACSVFDVSHMGRLRIRGRDAATLLDRLCTRNLSAAQPGRSYYSHMCRDDGGILDDVIVSRFEDEWGVVCNAANRAKIVAWIQDHASELAVELVDQTLSTAMLAIQGPRTLELSSAIAGEDLASIGRYGFRTFDLMGMSVVVYRSGYTGEDGFEVVVPAGMAKLLAPRLLGTPDAPHATIRPAGLGARDTLRIEAAMPLYGHELSEAVDSLTAGQAWCVDLSKDFIGAERLRRLEKEGLSRKLVGLELDGRRIARQHGAIEREGRSVGEITSGTLSPTLGKSIAMGFVASQYTDGRSELAVAIGSKRVPARVVALPFYRREKPTRRGKGDTSGEQRT